MYDPLGDYMKAIERVETNQVFDDSFPLYVRLDGRGFSKFTKDLMRPYDYRLAKAMISTTTHLVKETNAFVGYTQSDEISLLIEKTSAESQIMFNAKKQKLLSVLAGMTTAKFCHMINEVLPKKLHCLPHFDCRIFNIQVDDIENAFKWRVDDAKRNAVSMVAQNHFSHKKLNGISTKKKLEMLQEIGVDIEYNYPPHFRKGIFIKRVSVERMLTKEELSKIPEAHHPEGPVIRHVYEHIDDMTEALQRQND